LESTVLPARMNLFLQWLDSAGQPMRSHTYASQAFLFQKIDLIDQASHLRSFKQSGFLTPCPLELEESTYEGGGLVHGCHSRIMFRAIPEENFSREDQENQHEVESVGLRRL
jgi:hypothetical protein